MFDKKYLEILKDFRISFCTKTQNDNMQIQPYNKSEVLNYLMHDFRRQEKNFGQNFITSTSTELQIAHAT